MTRRKARSAILRPAQAASLKRPTGRDRSAVALAIDEAWLRRLKRPTGRL